MKAITPDPTVTEPLSDRPLTLIDVFEFMPFSTRSGETVYGLRFKYDKEIVERLRWVLADMRAMYKNTGRNPANVGGWLPDNRVWFIDKPVKQHVQAALAPLNIGYRRIPRPGYITHYVEVDEDGVIADPRQVRTPKDIPCTCRCKCLPCFTNRTSRR